MDSLYQRLTSEPASQEKPSTSTVVDDPWDLPGINDEPCPWEFVAPGTYYRADTGQTFTQTSGGASGGILETPA